MSTRLGDKWSRWLLEERFGGDEAALRRTLASLEPIRDRVIAGAEISLGSVVADVGCGDGLLGFAAARLVGEGGRVVFVDVSLDLLQRCSRIASELGLWERCRFVHASAEALEGLADESVDAVLTRSVLIYVDDKQSAFNEFRRVLEPGGRISLFEPINRRSVALNRNRLFGYDTSPVSDLAEKVRKVFEAASPADGPMMNFDETDLLCLAEKAGLSSISVTLELSSTDHALYAGTSWPALMRSSPNPNAPTYGEAIRRALDPEDASRLERYLRPLVDQGLGGRSRHANAYMTALRPPA